MEVVVVFCGEYFLHFCEVEELWQRNSLLGRLDGKLLLFDCVGEEVEHFLDTNCWDFDLSLYLLNN